MSIKHSEERKQIERQLKELDAKWDAARDEVQAAENAMNVIAQRMRALEKRLEELKPKAIKVSDHAVLRYLERKAGIDVEAIRKSILESELPMMVATLGGSGKFPVNGYQVVLKDYTVVTIN